MKRWLLATAAAAAVIVLATGQPSGAPKKGSQVTVRVLSAKVMAKPKFIGKSVTEVTRGAHLTYQGKKSGWYQVQTARGRVGWIHKSAVLDKKVELSSDLSSGKADASDEEIELAGRGFTEEVEEKYKREHGELDFSHVNNIEKLSLDPEQVGDFAAEGQVGGME